MWFKMHPWVFPIIIGIIGILLAQETMSKVASVLIVVLGIISFFIATFALAQPLYSAIIVGICIIMKLN